MATAAVSNSHKPNGDISAVFPSLSGKKAEPLPDRFRDLKLSYVRGKEEVLQRSWHRLLASLKKEIEEIRTRSSEVSMAPVKPLYFCADYPRLYRLWSSQMSLRAR